MGCVPRGGLARDHDAGHPGWRARRIAAQDAERQLRKEKSALGERASELDLEVARRLDAERQRLEATLRRTVAEEQDLKLKEKEK